MKWIIFFTFVLNGEVQQDQISITRDSIEMFGFTWTNIPDKGTYLEGGMNDVVNKAKLTTYTLIGNDTIKAYIHVKWNAVVVHIPKLNQVLTGNQLPHIPIYYTKQENYETKN